MTLIVRGDAAPLLRVLARHEVLDLVFPENDLDETFVRHYRRGPETPS